MKLLLKTFLFFLLSLALSFLLSLTFLMVEIMAIGVINALFKMGISHNNNLLSFLFWICFVIFTLILFFKFTSLKGKKLEISFFEKYQSKKEKDYVIVEVLFFPKSQKISSINLFFYQNHLFQKCNLILFNQINLFDYQTILKDKLLVFKDYQSYQQFNKLYNSFKAIILTAEYYLLTLKHSISLDDMVEKEKIIVKKDEKIYQYIEDNYNKYFVKSYVCSEVSKIKSVYFNLWKRDENDEKII